MSCVLCGASQHLFLGTHADNATDKKQKGRSLRTEQRPYGRAKLTEQQVREIIALHGIVTIDGLAERYGVRAATIKHIHSGQTWKRLA